MLLLAVVKYRNKIGYMRIPGSKKRIGGRFLHRSDAGHRVKRPPDAARRSGAAPLGRRRTGARETAEAWQPGNGKGRISLSEMRPLYRRRTSPTCWRSSYRSVLRSGS